MRIVDECSEVFDKRVRMLSITAVLRSHECELRLSLGSQGGSQRSTGKEHVVDRSGVLPMLSDGLGIELSEFKAENAMLNGDYLRQVIEIVFGGVQTILEIRFMCLFLSLGRILLQCSIMTNLVDPLRHPVDFWKVDDGI